MEKKRVREQKRKSKRKSASDNAFLGSIVDTLIKENRIDSKNSIIQINIDTYWTTQVFLVLLD